MDGIFNRTEEKYLVPADKYDGLFGMLKQFMCEDEYGLQPIHNIYFDTKCDDLILRSIEKPFFKEKLRLRSYGTASGDKPVYLELKKKFGGIVYKRRMKLPYSDAKRYLSGEIPETNERIGKELNYFFSYYKMLPKLFLAYDRLALFAASDKKLRVTFDGNIRYRTECFDLSKEYSNEPYGGEKFYIMEIKALNAMPLWLTQILTEMRLYPASFSKYGNIYKKLHTKDFVL
ncbi:MAG: polyphosphate polymerase domain-containing protein [Clostridiales bacterium]|jgi:SPX domain protein involved in polyphosphate accumulation|nr:polyphosphate polymerase domain-containing protein [Clostridiales bacterium]